MDFDFTEEQKMLRSNAKAFLDKEIAPMVDEREKKGTTFTKEEEIYFIKKLRPLGYYTGGLPEEYGGQNLNFTAQGILEEEIGRVWPSLTVIMSAGAHLEEIARRGTEEQKKRFLPRLLEPETLCNGALSEPDVGSAAPAGIETRAVLDKDTYVINGTKIWVGNADVAGLTIVVVKTGAAGEADRIEQIIVEREVSPFGVRELRLIGWSLCPRGELSFVDCRVPKENLLKSAAGRTQRQEVTVYLDVANARLALMSVGIAQAAIDASLKYVRERKQFGRPIGGFQLVQEMLVDMVTENEAARFLAYRALDLADKGQRCRWQCAMAKAFACEMGVHVTSKAIQIHGAVGVVTDYPIERYFRDARVMTIAEGTTQIRKLVVGRELIGIRAIT